MRRIIISACFIVIAACDEFTDVEESEAFDLEPRGLSVTPTDPLFNLQKWHYNAIRMPEAWGLTTGSNNVLVAVADSGKRNHPDLNANWSGGYDFYSGDADATDPGTYHHGIHVAGTIGARANNNQGGAGVCWNCALMPLRVAQSGGSQQVGDPGYNEPTTTLIARAIRYAAGLPVPNGHYQQTVQSAKRADVVNISIGNIQGPCPTDLRNALVTAAAAGTMVVVSAGNGDSGYIDYPTTPDFNPANYLWTSCNKAGSHPNLVVVAAVDGSGNAEEYTLKGSGFVTLAAPGGADVGGKGGSGELIGCLADPDEPGGTGKNGVVSSWVTSTDNSCYRHWAGTSMAAPHVTGVIGLMRSRNPALTVSQVKTILEKTTKKTIPCGSACGAGMIDAYRAVNGATFDMQLFCGSSGGGAYFCDPLLTGGVESFSASWQAISNVSISDGQQGTPSSITGGCSVGKVAKIKATFTDAIGRTITRQTQFQCTNIPA